MSPWVAILTTLCVFLLQLNDANACATLSLAVKRFTQSSQGAFQGYADVTPSLRITTDELVVAPLTISTPIRYRHLLVALSQGSDCLVLLLSPPPHVTGCMDNHKPCLEQSCDALVSVPLPALLPCCFVSALTPSSSHSWPTLRHDWVVHDFTGLLDRR